MSRAVRTRPVLTPSSPTIAALWANFLMGSRVGGSGPFERFYRSRTTFALHYNGYSLGSARRDIVLWVTRTIRRRSRVLTRKTLQCGPDEKLEGIKALRRRVRAKNLLTSRRIQYIPRQPSVMESKISKFHALLNTAVRQLPIKKFAHKAANGRRPLPQVSGHCRTPVAGGARSRALAGAVLPCGVHTAGGDRRHRLSEQGGDLRPAVQSLGRNHAHDRCRSQASRRSHRLHIGDLHIIVPGGGLSLDNARWVADRSNFLVHVNVLARLFRAKMLAMLMDAQDSGKLKFFNTHAGLAEKRTFKHFIAALRRIHWVVHCKAPVAGPEKGLR